MGCIKRMFHGGASACVVAIGQCDVGRSLRRMDVDRNRVLVLHVNMASRNPQLMAVPTPVPIAMATATDADSRRDTAGRYWSGLMDRCASPCNFSLVAQRRCRCCGPGNRLVLCKQR